MESNGKSRTIYEVWNKSYDTFGEGDTYCEGRYYDIGAANMHAYLLNKSWGNRAHVETVTPKEVSNMTVPEVMERYNYLKKALTHKEIKEIVAGG